MGYSWVWMEEVWKTLNWLHLPHRVVLWRCYSQFRFCCQNPSTFEKFAFSCQKSMMFLKVSYAPTAIQYLAAENCHSSMRNCQTFHHALFLATGGRQWQQRMAMPRHILVNAKITWHHAFSGSSLWKMIWLNQPNSVAWTKRIEFCTPCEKASRFQIVTSYKWPIGK